MKKEVITKTSLVKVTNSELTKILRKGGLLSKSQEIKYLKSLVRQMEYIEIIVTEQVTIEVPDNIPDSILNYSLGDLDISMRLYNLLISTGVDSIAGILSQGASLKKMRGMGEKTYMELIEMIKDVQKMKGFTEFDLTTLMQ